MNNLTIKIFALALLTAIHISIAAQNQQPPVETTAYKEHYCNQYHFSVSRGWISDPCGLLYYEGKYHCYWWGCAESPYLVHFTEINRRSQMDVWPMQSIWNIKK